ncbi:MAG: hydrogenase formation protein HypD [Thermoprotei archaeon]|nr:MAG: hydrogenase formation protein HypD [Thermoprotei archaeon]
MLKVDINRLVRNIHKLAKGLGDVRIMGFCGTHEYVISYYGIRSLMPENVELIAGPGCPVCVVPAAYIDECIKLALDGIRVFTYGDMYRVPGTEMSLSRAKAEGADVKIVYSFLDAIRLAKDGKESVFFGVGFETTQPSVASRLVHKDVPRNLKIISAYRLTPPIMRYILDEVRDIAIDGIIAPGHVSTIIGSNAWKFLAEDYGLPVVVAGFEPEDVLIAIFEILRQIKFNDVKLFNEYSRVVRSEGNIKAWRYVGKVFDVVSAGWRGIGIVKESGLELKNSYAEYDARLEYGLDFKGGRDVAPGCRCADIILGRAKPTECPLFMRVCNPSSPKGPCMVSSEGTCAIWARYGNLNKIRVKTKDFKT